MEGLRLKIEWRAAAYRRYAADAQIMLFVIINGPCAPLMPGVTCFLFR